MKSVQRYIFTSIVNTYIANTLAIWPLSSQLHIIKLSFPKANVVTVKSPYKILRVSSISPWFRHQILTWWPWNHLGSVPLQTKTKFSKSGTIHKKTIRTNCEPPPKFNILFFFIFKKRALEKKQNVLTMVHYHLCLYS